jgi:hypothetical protein
LGEALPKEKARILRLLDKRVEYHAKDGSVEIAFRLGGVRAMGVDEAKEADGTIRS